MTDQLNGNAAMTCNNKVKDVVVIGGGIIGSSILRELSRYELNIMLLEKQPDVCEGASKANSGIIHTGFDAPPGSIEAECLRRSRLKWPRLIEQLKIPFLSCGAVMVAADEQEKQTILRKYVPNANSNGVVVRWLEKEEVLAANPAVSDAIIGGLLIEGEGIIDPFWATRSFAELALMNGAEVRTNSGVEQIRKEPGTGLLELVLENGDIIRSRYAVNAAGLWSDEIGRMAGDESFVITPRKGQFILTEDPIAISNIVLPVPNPASKGILVTPVVFGGFIIGPTAEDQESKWDRSTSSEGMDRIIQESKKLIPDIDSYHSIRQFAGVRAVCSTGDFVIRQSDVEARLIHAAGIRSTGISASPGVAELTVECLKGAGLSLRLKENAHTELEELFDGAVSSSEEIVCLCRSITRSEIEKVKHNRLPCHTVDGVKRRTGATLGECQGNYCIPKIIELLDSPDNDFGKRPAKGLQDSCFAYRKGDGQV